MPNVPKTEIGLFQCIVWGSLFSLQWVKHSSKVTCAVYGEQNDTALILASKVNGTFYIFQVQDQER